MAGESGDGGDAATLETTPTWAVATVCFCLISVSILIEHCLHLLAKYLSRKRRKYLIHALNKIKSDLMLLGFISLFLTVFERPISNICVPKGVAHSFLPCHSLTSEEEEESKCEQQGKLSLISRLGIQQLQMLIFFLAFFHVLSSFLTFSLGIAKMRRWKHWEAETRTFQYEFSNDHRRFQFIHQTSFGRRHLKFWSEHPLLRWPACFVRQFFGSVYKVDYFTLRHGFIVAHFAQQSNFNFQKYITRALDKDFGVVVGMRVWIWIFSVLFIFFNAHAFRNYFWLPWIPLVMLLVVGTKLQAIITKMCLDSSDKSHVVQGTLLVRPSDHFFWFDRPKLLLHLMHFILFQNSFQLAFFAWSWYRFGLRSCFHRQTEDIVIKLAVGVMVNFLCGYVTLPLYALITQMGSSMRNTIFTDEVIGGLRRWRIKAKKNLAQKQNTGFAHRSLDGLFDTSVGSSPSFNTLDSSFSVKIGHASEDGDVLYEDSVARRQLEQQQLGSFGGFELSRTYQ